MNNKSGVTLVTMVIIVIVIVIISTISIIGGTEIIGEAKESKKASNLAAIQAMLNKMNLQDGTAGVFTPANSKRYGKPASEVLQEDIENLEGWYILEEEDLEEMGVKYYGDTYLVNYDDSIVITMNEYLLGEFVGGFYPKKSTIGDLVKKGKIDVGNYIEYIPEQKSYEPDSSKFGVSNSSLQTNEDLVWRVFYIDKKTGDILISPETESNKVSISLKTTNNVMSEVEEICQQLYSNESLGITARNLTADDLVIASGGSTEKVTRRMVWYLEGANVEEGSSVLYNGFEWEVLVLEDSRFKDSILYDTEVIDIEGGEIATGPLGKEGRKITVDKPVYVSQEVYNITGTEKLKGIMKNDTSGGRTIYMPYSVLSTRNEYIQGSWYKGWGIPVIYVNNGVVQNVNVWLASTNFYNKDTVYIRPAVVLKSNVLIDDTIGSIDGKTLETAWKLKMQ